MAPLHRGAEPWMRRPEAPRDGDGLDIVSRTWDEAPHMARRVPSPRPTGAIAIAARPALDPEAMRVFAAIARANGVRGAAAALALPRSTVSRRLGQLEEAVGATLVVRTERRFALTELGRALFDRCLDLEQLLRRTGEEVQSATGEAAGVLRVAAAPVLGEEVLPEILSRLLARHPHLSVDVKVGVDYVDLRDGNVDVALRAWAIEDASDLFATRLSTSVTGCWVSPAYARAHGVPETPEDLASHACIVVGSHRPTTWELVVDGTSVRVPIDGRVRVDSFRLARSLAVLGAGIVRTARMFAARLVANGELVPVLERYWPETAVSAVHAGPNPPTPKVRAFIDLAREVVSRFLAGEDERAT
jgi:DNA-binding transcriptional LysR family regulator